MGTEKQKNLHFDISTWVREKESPQWTSASRSTLSAMRQLNNSVEYANNMVGEPERKKNKKTTRRDGMGPQYDLRPLRHLDK